MLLENRIAIATVLGTVNQVSALPFFMTVHIRIITIGTAVIDLQEKITFDIFSQPY